jgi:hypothetical protein
MQSQVVTPRISTPEKKKRPDYKTSVEAFVQQNEQLNALLANLQRLTALVYSESVKPGMRQPTKPELAKLWSQAKKHQARQAMMFRASVNAKKVKRDTAGNIMKRPGSAYLKQPFFVSDQLVSFINNSKLGNGLIQYFATSEVDPNVYGNVAYNVDGANGALEGANGAVINANPQVWPSMQASNVGLERSDVRSYLTTLLEEHISTPAQLISIFHLIIKVNRLSSVSNPKRYHIDQVMVSAYGPNTHFHFKGQDLHGLVVNMMANQGSVRTFSLNPEQLKTEGLASLDSIRKSLNSQAIDGNLSVFQRVANRPRKVSTARGRVGQLNPPDYVPQGSETPGTDDWGLSIYTFSMISSFFHIPTVPELNLNWALLKNPRIVEQIAIDTTNIKNVSAVYTFLHAPAAQQRSKDLTKAKREAATAAKAQQQLQFPGQFAPGASGAPLQFQQQQQFPAQFAPSSPQAFAGQPSFAGQLQQ